MSSSVAKASTITLSSGRKLTLHGLSQELTNEGILEGVPTTQMNKRHVDGLIAEQIAKRPNGSVYLVNPTETPLEMTPGQRYPFGSPALLPNVTCRGRFRSESIGDEIGCYSELTVIWFQADFALPIEPTVLEEIVCLDWGAVASDSSDW
jgi:hypothetical protein